MLKMKTFFQYTLNEATSDIEVSKISAEAKFKWEFPTGKYRIEDIDSANLKELRSEIAQKILGPLYDGSVTDGKSVITLIASTSNLRVTPSLLQQLKSEGYNKEDGDESGNSALAKGRLGTIKKIMYQMMKIEDETQLGQYIEIVENVSYNAGEGKAFQFIASNIEFLGQKLKNIISCKDDLPFKIDGKKGEPENNYVGYSSDKIGLTASANTKIKLILSPFNIPDCFFLYLDKDNYYLSPFIGNNSDENRKDGKDYFKKQINSNDMKKDLLPKMVKEIGKLIGFTNAQKLVDKTILNKDGNIRIVEREDDESLYATEFIKSIKVKFLRLRVFAPLADTGFSIGKVCAFPQYDLVSGKITGYKDELGKFNKTQIATND